MTETQGWFLIAAVLLLGTSGVTRTVGAAVMILGMLSVVLHRPGDRHAP